MKPKAPRVPLHFCNGWKGNISRVTARTMAAAPKLPQLRRIAWRLWDPIGLCSADPLADDEYDAYLLRVVEMLQAGSSPAEAVKYLNDIEANYMGLGWIAGATDRAADTVALIRAYLRWLAAPTKHIELDASGWASEDDLWNALLGSLGVPDWHGHNYNALWETVTEIARGGAPDEELINRVQPPFHVVVRNAGDAPPLLAKRLREIGELLADAKEELDLTVGLTVEAS